MTAGMRIFLVVALVLAGGIGIVRVVEGDDAETPSVVVPQSTAVSTAVPPATAPSSTMVAPTAAPTVAPTVAVDTLSPMLSSQCPDGDHAAVVDREQQRAWLCEAGTAVYEFAFTGAVSQPDPGPYPVYAKDMNSSSTSSAGVSTMTHFVAFTHGKFRGARIAFHSMPRWTSNGEWVQPLDTIGDLSRRGESAGCLRVLPDDAQRVWDWLSNGDEVRVIN